MNHATELIQFDAFGTFLDMKDVPREEIRAYLAHVTRPTYAPLMLPESWDRIPAFADSAEGIRRLRSKYIVTTCSNGPLRTLARASKNAGIDWDAIVPLETAEAFKPSADAYLLPSLMLGVNPANCMMVTGNKTFAHYEFGDVEASTQLGMQAQLIRNPGCPQTIIELAEALGC